MNENQVILAGNLTRDVELKFTPSNKAVANIGLALNHRYKTASGEQKEDVTFVDCEAWGQIAEAMAKYLSKGRPVYIKGRLKTETWVDKQSGGNRSKLKVVVESFQFVGPRPDGSGDARVIGTQHATSVSAARATDRSQTYEPIQEDDIPF